MSFWQETYIFSYSEHVRVLRSTTRCTNLGSPANSKHVAKSTSQEVWQKKQWITEALIFIMEALAMFIYYPDGTKVAIFKVSFS
jgi:hypothetical protein